KMVPDNDLDGLSADDFLNIYSVNVVGAYQMTRAVAPHMKAQGRGSIVNTSSIAGVMGIGSSIAYAASKGAMPRASRPVIMPDSTSPAPAVASHGAARSPVP
ncbi:SDR family oxidoreductase, partial [uncultured Sulfitobacter sp.]|uniref:SDR family oxidoreductase n=1 Tax=uncultured Sulfitobacter sp. TaxID=191468 RepID=UPI0025961886